MAEKIGEIKQKLEETDISLLPAFVEQYKTDVRAGVQKLVQTAGKRYQKLQDEIARTEALKKYEKEYDNYHFEEQVEDDKVTFDYCLREGRACTRNAIRLLKMLGYDEKIVDDANERVALFLKSGNWVSSH